MALNTRKIASDIIYNVLKKEQTLSHELSHLRISNDCTELDVKFISEITNGVLRNLEYLDYVISASSDIRLNKISPYVLSVLRCGVYQLIFMDKVPSSAAVNESVKVIKKSSNYRLAGFVNAVLRKADSIKNTLVMPEDELENLSVRYSCPLWIIKKLQGEVSDLHSLLVAMNSKPATILRVNTSLTTPEDLIKSLTCSGWKCERYKSPLFPHIDYLISAEKIERLEESPEFKDGLFYIQDCAATYVGEVLNPQPHSVVFDMCASPGGKTTHFASLMNNTGTVYAFDVSKNKTDRIDENVKRLRLSNVKTMVMDSSVYNEIYKEKADYILVDSPCSGIGIIRKKPDIKYMRREEDISNLSKISLDILNTSAKYLKPGGTMVFSTCTIFKEENEDVLFAFLEKNPDFKLKKISCLKANNGYMTLYPHTDECDGFFISLIEKEK